MLFGEAIKEEVSLGAPQGGELLFGDNSSCLLIAYCNDRDLEDAQ